MRIGSYAYMHKAQGGRAMKKKFENKRVIDAVIVSSIIFVSIFVYLLKSSSKYCEIHPVIEVMMNELSLSDCYLKTIGDYSDINYELDIPQISNEKIQSYIESEKLKYGIEEITSEFVMENYGCNSIDDFNQLVENRLSEQEKIEMILSTRQLIVKQLIEQCSFELDPDTVAQYALEVVNDYETGAYLYNMSLEEYCSIILKISYDDFFDFVYDESEYLIKTYLVIGAVAFDELDEYTRDAIPTNEQDIYNSYQEIENQVYDMFIHADDDF